MEPIGMKEIKKPCRNDRVLCGAGWTRTTDSRIFSPMLYHLSYSTLRQNVGAKVDKSLNQTNII